MMTEAIPRISKYPLTCGVLPTMLYIAYTHYVSEAKRDALERNRDRRLDEQHKGVSARLDKIDGTLGTMKVEIGDHNTALAGNRYYVGLKDRTKALEECSPCTHPIMTADFIAR